MRPITRRHRPANRANVPTRAAVVAVAGLLLGTGARSSTGDTPQEWPHVFGLRDVCLPATDGATRYLISFGNIEPTSGQTLETIEADITGDPPPDLQIMVGGDWGAGR